MAEKKGKKLRRCSKYKAYYTAQYAVTYKNKRRKINREIQRLKNMDGTEYERAIDLREQELKNLDAKYMRLK